MIFALTNQKGGVGKTTSSINLGSSIADRGYRVLLVDFDPQSNLTSGIGQKSSAPSVYEVISMSADIKECIVPTYQDKLFLLPSSHSLSGAEVELASLSNKEFFLKNALAPISADYDFIFIDCPPSLGILTVNAFCACEEVIIPLQCEYFAIEGIVQLVSNIKRIQNKLNPRINLFGIILTMYDTRTNLSQEVVAEIVEAFGKNVFQTIIPRNVKIAEAPSYGKSIIAYDPNCVGSKSYVKLAEEVITKWNTKK